MKNSMFETKSPHGRNCGPLQINSHPRSQGSLLSTRSVGRVGENSGNEVGRPRRWILKSLMTIGKANLAPSENPTARQRRLLSVM